MSIFAPSGIPTEHILAIRYVPCGSRNYGPFAIFRWVLICASCVIHITIWANAGFLTSPLWVSYESPRAESSIRGSPGVTMWDLKCAHMRTWRWFPYGSLYGSYSGTAIGRIWSPGMLYTESPMARYMGPTRNLSYISSHGPYLDLLWVPKWVIRWVSILPMRGPHSRVPHGPACWQWMCVCYFLSVCVSPVFSFCSPSSACSRHLRPQAAPRLSWRTLTRPMRLTANSYRMSTACLSSWMYVEFRSSFVCLGWVS